VTEKVVEFFPANAAKDPDNVLKQAIGEYDEVLIIGVSNDNVTARASDGLAELAQIILIMELFKASLLHGDFE